METDITGLLIYYYIKEKKMKIKFNNGKIFNYTNAQVLLKDYKDGYTRSSITVEMPYEQTNFNEIYNLLHGEAVNYITLIGDTVEYTNENGERISNTPTSVYENYNVVGEVAVEDDRISFKLYEQISSMEKERNAAIRAVDELLLAMEG